MTWREGAAAVRWIPVCNDVEIRAIALANDVAMHRAGPAAGSAVGTEAAKNGSSAPAPA